MSKSKTKLASLMLLDSINGYKVPSEDDINEVLKDALLHLEKSEGISNIKQTKDFKNYIFTIACDFKNIESINGAQELISKIPSNASAVVTIKGRNITQLMSVDDFSSSKLGQMMIKEISKETDEKITTIEGLGLDLEKDFHYFLEAAISYLQEEYDGMTMMWNDNTMIMVFAVDQSSEDYFYDDYSYNVETVEEVVEAMDAAEAVEDSEAVEEVEEAVEEAADTVEEIVEEAIEETVIESTENEVVDYYDSPGYKKQEADREKRRQEWQAKKDQSQKELAANTLKRAKQIFGKNNATNSILKNTSYMKSIGKNNAEATVWVNDFMKIYEETMLNSMSMLGAGNPYEFMNLGVIYDGISVAGKLDFEEDKATFKMAYTMNDEMAKLYKPMYNDKLLGYWNLNTSTEGTLVAYPKLLDQMFKSDSKNTISNSVSLASNLVSILLDEEAAATIVRGDMLLALTDLREQTVTYTDYEYDEDYNYKEIEKTKTETIPDFIFMFTSEQEKLFKNLMRIGIYDVSEFERFIKKELDKKTLKIQDAEDKSYRFALIKDLKTQLAWNEEKLIVTTSFNSSFEKAKQVYLDILVHAKTIKDSDHELLKALKNEASHITYADAKSTMNLDFNDGIAYLKGITNDEAAEKYPNEVAVAMNSDASLSLKLADRTNGFFSIEVHGKTTQQDTIVTYEYDDNFEKIETKTLQEKEVPKINIKLGAENESLKTYLSEIEALDKNNVFTPFSIISITKKGMLPQGASTKNCRICLFWKHFMRFYQILKHHSEEEVVELVKKRWKGIKLLRKNLGDANIDFQEHGGHELFLNDNRNLYEECLTQMEAINNLLRPVFGEKAFVKNKNIFQFNNIQENYITHQFEGQIDTGMMMNSLLKLVLSKGIQVLNSITVESFTEKANEVEVKTNQFEFKTKKLLIATNGFASKLIKEEVKPARAQVLITKPIKNLDIKGTFHLDEGYYYFRNINDRILFGGGRNLDFKGEETDDRLQTILKETILPNTTFEIDRSWSGIMGIGDQKKPVVKQLSNNVFCGVRLGGMGIAIGSLVGDELANLP
ncbi:hypothetical protein GQR58_030216 [Nymphon striatum]|nr:hypothetical protein GQR58_030216 [Nymphon striatum]